MKITPQTLLALHQSNVELQLDLCTLLANCQREVVNAALDTLQGCTADFAARFATLLSAPAEGRLVGAEQFNAPWAMLQRQNRLLQQLAETGLDLQKQLGTEGQKAISAWQQAAASALEDDLEVMPLSASLQKPLNAYFRLSAPWTNIVAAK